ncbi:sulfatase family protein [Synoicihabitans lomoniglobus]|uniref:Sulfatase-like hydrolase/transferase n=1 Tax=Synoicihabitans lomoniglobus TaxID=2909285 RepID=A0AAE9ZVB9_9BACT|nr:sulfatase-like hydrolase/transferase [Opitutaceae bacterium LMO-M01]WED64061.1 sulfatase-like hydrolase/transferase [Opitutaceae bacterium LMO-M01]
MNRPDILYLVTDQQRFDTIRALGNASIHTPNLDRLAVRGLTFNQAYSPCPVCVPARYVMRTGCQPATTGFSELWRDRQFTESSVRERCGPYLAERMSDLGYRTFGIGKFHTDPWDEDLGYEDYLQTWEHFGSPEMREADPYARWLGVNHPTFDYLEALYGERSEMYYVPQTRPLPAELCAESWCTDRAIERINVGPSDDSRPFFGMVSFIGPHPPFAPPLPFNRMYDPDQMPSPICGDRTEDHRDEQIPWMNQIIWAEGISDPLARILKARYYGEISFIDRCLGRILDEVEARPDPDNVLICFCSDHGDHLGDHHGWQKESFFDASARIPFLVSWPARLPRNERRDDLVSLTDLFGLATGAAGNPEPREGIDLLSTIQDARHGRDMLFGTHSEPGGERFKIMVRDPRWKYIFMANGGYEQLFNLRYDPHELHNRITTEPTHASRLKEAAQNHCRQGSARDAVDDRGELRRFPFKARQTAAPYGTGNRVLQFDLSRGIRGFSSPAESHRDPG